MVQRSLEYSRIAVSLDNLKACGVTYGQNISDYFGRQNLGSRGHQTDLRPLQT